MNSYRSLDAWKLAHQIALDVLGATDQALPRRTWAVVDQVRRAAVSVEANIVEGYALGTIPLFRRHLRIALGSAAEVECLLNLATERDYLPTTTTGPLLAVTGRALSTIRGLMRSPKIRGASGRTSRRTTHDARANGPL